MSTSDPHRPSGATDPTDETTTPDATTGTSGSVEKTTPSADDSPAHEVAPTVETLDPPAPSEASSTPAVPSAAAPETAQPDTAKPAATRTTEPVAGTVDAELPPATAAAAGTAAATGTAASTRSASEPAADTGRHAVVRPAPTPPDEPSTTPTPPSTDTLPDPVRSPTTTTPEPVAEPAAAPAPVVAAAPVAASSPTASTQVPVAEDDERLFPDPNAPRSTSVGSHILGVIVGLILAPVGVAVLLLGESRILQAQVDGWDASTEVLGIVLVSVGLLLLGCVLLLALWTPAVPITGGAVLTLAGIVYLYLPSIAREQTLNLLTQSGWRVTITQVTVAGTSGMVLAVGFLLLLAGIVTGLARRRGVRLGEFRERHRA